MNASQKRHIRGFSLIEVLVTLVVLSLGLMGLAGLQITALKMNQAASARSLATQYAYAMLDKVRSRGKDGAADYICGNLSQCAGRAQPAGSDLDTFWSQLSGKQGDSAVWTPSLPEAKARIFRRETADVTPDTGCFGPEDQPGGEVFVVCIGWSQGNDAKLGIGASNGTNDQSIWAAAKLF
ncbi:MAG: type IV pilus modification protein PilV [Azoarcus sp.]|jgi:type IV pilus assembly protein PilV|nr:type IV pilus modification protein PilV [Azoarcus sp.]